jgi:glycosyltransferase involved in cell wall biosynthesis
MSGPLDPSAPPAAALRVSLDARFIGFAGIGKWVQGIWQGLVENGADVVALWPSGPPGDWMGSRRPTPVGPCLPIGTRPFFPTEQLTVPRALGRIDADVHHAPNWAVPYLTRRPVVLTVHDLYPYLDPTVASTRTRAAVYRTVVPLAVRKARRLVAVSPLAARQLVETFGVGDDRLRVVEHGIDHDRFKRPADGAVGEVRASFALPPEYLLYVGTLKPHKNLRTLLAAHGPEHPPLVLAGPSAEELSRSELSRLIRGKVIAIGRVQDELPALSPSARVIPRSAWTPTSMGATPRPCVAGPSRRSR